MKIAAIAAVMLAATVPATWGQFGDGTHLVGVDIEPGLYRASGSGRSFCRWERLSGLGGEFGDTIGVGTSQLVEIKRSDKAFKVTGCGSWEPVEVGSSVSGSAPDEGAAALLAAVAILAGVEAFLDLGDRWHGAFLPILGHAGDFLVEAHELGYLSDSEKEAALSVLDGVFEEVMAWPSPQDDS